MNYFDQLLESYNRLKKRTLVLREEDEEKEETGRIAAEAFFTKADPERNVTNLATADQNKAPYAYKKDSLTKVTGGPLGNTTINGASFDAMEQQYPVPTKKLINYFGTSKGSIDNDEGLNDEARLQAESRAGRQLEKAGLLDSILNSNMAGILARTTKIAQIARDLFPETYGEEAWTQPEKAQTYATGSSAQSLERKIANGTIAIIDPELGFSEGPLASQDNLELLRGATASINSFLNFATGSITDMNSRSQCLALNNRVKKKGNKYVFHSYGDTTQGIVLSGKLDQFKFAEKELERICSKGLTEIPRGSLEGDYTPQELADYRGTGLEVTFAAATFYDIVNSGVLSPAAEKIAREKFGKKMRQKLLKNEAKFKQANIWAQRLAKQGNATDLDSQFVIDALDDLKAANFGEEPEGANNFYTAAFALEKLVVETIKPQMSLPVGQQTGAGYKDDLKYVFFGKDALDRANAAAGLMGSIPGRRADKLDAPVEKTTVGDLKEISPEVAAIYQDAYGLSDNDVVYSVGSSIKSYMKDGSTKAGEIKEWERRSRLARQVEKDQVAPGFYEITKERLDFDDADLLEVASYQEELDSVYSTLDSLLPTDVTAQVMPDGEVVQVTFNTILPLIEAKLNTLPLDSPLRIKMEELSGTDENPRDLTDFKTRGEYKEELSRLMVAYKQTSDANKKDGKTGDLTPEAQKARKNLAWTVHMVGATARDSALNKKILEEASVSVGSHMKPITDATLGILNPDSDWVVKIDSEGSTMKLSKKNSSQNVSLGSKRKKKADGTRHTNSSVLVSKESGHLSREIESPPKDSGNLDDNLLFDFLSGQAKLLEELISRKTN